MWDDGAGPDCLHGPSSSAERLDGGGRRTRKQVEAGHNWWKERVKRLERQWTPKGTDSTIFRGVTAFFEGYTEQTSSYHLKKLLLSHGGSVSHYFSKRKTTHVICTNLSASKWTNLLFTGSGASKRVKAVHPDWLHRSCEAGVKLPEDDFLISTPNSNAKDDNPSYSSSTSLLPPSMVSSPSSSATAKQPRRPSIQDFFAASSSSSTKRTREEILENEKRDKENIPSERKQQDYQPSREDYKRPNSQNKQSTHQSTSTSLSRSSSSSSSSAAAASFPAAGSASATNKKEENEKKTKHPRKRRRNESTDAFLSRLFGAASHRQHLVQQFPLAQSVPPDSSLLSQ
ncbi:hypothetical protein QOT17_004316 [Balamuthia mandrillaris]